MVLFGSISIHDNTAFPLREHTKKSESEIRNIVMEKLELVGMPNDGHKFPGEISGGMRERAGLAREVLLTSEEPVVKAFLNDRRIGRIGRIGPTGMSEEKDEATPATPAMPERRTVARRKARVRVREILRTLPPAAQEAILEDFEGTTRGSDIDDAPTASIPVVGVAR